MIVYFNKNSPSCECQLNSIIQRTSRGTKGKKTKLVEVKGVEEWKVENTKQKKIRGVTKYLIQ